MRNLNPYAGTPGENQLATPLVKSWTLPTSGMVTLMGPEVLVVDTPEFQRLDGIKQLGTTYMVYRGARHTRFEHSLGTLHRAEQMLQWLERNPKRGAPVPSEARRLTRMAALLHDLPHVPFGHTLEDEFGLLARHDTNSTRMEVLLDDGSIGEVLRSYLGEEEFDELRRVIRAKSDEEIAALKYPFSADIVGNTLCADLLDYTQRDFHHCGMLYAFGDHFLSYLTLTRDDEAPDTLDRNRLALMLDKEGLPRPDVESDIVKVLTMRYELAERVYYHHAKNAASVMIGRAVQALGLANGPDHPATHDSNFHWMSDDQLLQVLETPALAALLGLQVDNATLEAGSPLARDLAAGIRTRRLYKVAYLAIADDLQEGANDVHRKYGRTPTARRALEDDIAAKAGLAPGRVLVHLPATKMMRKDADVRVITSRGSVVKFGTWDERHGGRVAALNKAHEQLWRLTVYVHPDDASNGALKLVQEVARGIFGAPSRVRVDPMDPYLEELFHQYAQERNWQWDELDYLKIPAYSEATTKNEVLDLMDSQIAVGRQMRATREETSPGNQVSPTGDRPVTPRGLSSSPRALAEKGEDPA